MDSETLLNAIEAAEETAYGRDKDTLSSDRETAIDYYLGKPFGNEVEGRSQIVSRDVMDTIEWIKPAILRIFTGGEKIVQFEPTGPEDEAGAEQETDYINYIVQQKNNWFDVMLTWTSDALLTKNAYALAYWDEKVNTTRESYQGITTDQLAMMDKDEGIKIVQAEQIQQAPQIGPDGQPMQAEPLWNVTAEKEKKYGCVKIEVLPPERCLVSESTPGRSVRNADFFEYWDHKSISSLREMGFDVADDISDDGSQAEFSLEDQARDQYGERFMHSQTTTDSSDPSMRKVRARMVWIKYDYDQDGIAEYIQCITVGRTILTKKDDEQKDGIYPVDGIPVAVLVPTPLPHRHPGLSVADAVMDIQFIKSVVIRQVLDNLYLSNNPRTAIGDQVNIDDMLTARVGGLVRVGGGQAPAQQLMPLVTPFIGPQALQTVEYLDQIRENRTGTNRYFTGVDQNALNRTATGIAQLTSSAAQRVEMIARIFAEGVKELFQVVHELTLKHSMQSEVVRLRGKWVPIDPRQWKTRTDMTIAVGLGTGNKESMAANLMNVLKAQMAVMPIGVAQADNIHATLTELVKAYGFNSPERFLTDPKQQQQQPPKPDPEMVKLEQEFKLKVAALEKKGELDRAALAQKGEIAREGQALDANLERERMGLEAAVEHEANTLNAQVEHHGNTMNAATERHGNVMGMLGQINTPMGPL